MYIDYSRIYKDLYPFWLEMQIKCVEADTEVEDEDENAWMTEVDYGRED